MRADDSSQRQAGWSLDQESFDRLLAWLDSDREQAGRRYEEIRFELIKFFVRKGSSIAEELADETITRVARKVPEIASTYTGDPMRYFMGVARKVFLESIKKRPAHLPPPPPDAPEIIERNHQCLEICMQQLTANGRALILNYFVEEEGHAKIVNHQMLAEQLGISLNTLRMRAYRTKIGLRECVLKCVNKADD